MPAKAACKSFTGRLFVLPSLSAYLLGLNTKMMPKTMAAMPAISVSDIAWPHTKKSNSAVTMGTK